jgi:hypothetical protein
MTVDALKKWADRELGIDPAHAAEHVLQLSGTSERPAGSTLGTLSHGHDHRVSFDLVPNERFRAKQMSARRNFRHPMPAHSARTSGRCFASVRRTASGNCARSRGPTP